MSARFFGMLCLELFDSRYSCDNFSGTLEIVMYISPRENVYEMGSNKSSLNRGKGPFRAPYEFCGCIDLSLNNDSVQ